jgi:ankyrin repeat protein
MNRSSRSPPRQSRQSRQSSRQETFEHFPHEKGSFYAFDGMPAGTSSNDMSYHHALVEAINSNNLPTVMQLVESGKPNTAISNAINIAAFNGRLDIIRSLLNRLAQRGYDHDYIKTYYLNSALISAVSGKHPDIVQYLLQVGADNFDNALLVARAGRNDIISRILEQARYSHPTQGPPTFNGRWSQP